MGYSVIDEPEKANVLLVPFLGEVLTIGFETMSLDLSRMIVHQLGLVHVYVYQAPSSECVCLTFRSDFEPYLPAVLNLLNTDKKTAYDENGISNWRISSNGQSPVILGSRLPQGIVLRDVAQVVGLGLIPNHQYPIMV